MSDFYGILASATNTAVNSGIPDDPELQCVFVAPIAIVSNQPAYSQDSMSLKRRTSSQGYQRWEIEANLMPSTGSASFITHALTNGIYSTFFLRMPQIFGLSTSAAGLTVGGSGAAAGSDTFVASGATPMIPGEFIRFSNHAKVYMVTKVAGQNTTVSPKLKADIPNGTTSIYTGPRVTLNVNYDSSTRIGITFKDGVLQDPGSFKFIEVL